MEQAKQKAPPREAKRRIIRRATSLGGDAGSLAIGETETYAGTLHDANASDSIASMNRTQQTLDSFPVCG